METVIKIPENIYMSMKIPDIDKEKTLLVEFAIMLYNRGILSFGKARELAKLSKWEFDEELGKRTIERHYDKYCFEEDLKYGNGNI